MELMIPDQFVKYGDQFRLMSIVGDYRIYRRGNGERCSFEIMKPIMIKGELQLPGTSFWGIYGWTCADEVAVIRKIGELVSGDKVKVEKEKIKTARELVGS